MLTPLIPKAQASPNFPDLSCFEELHTLLGLAQHDSTAATHICHWPNESKNIQMTQIEDCTACEQGQSLRGLLAADISKSKLQKAELSTIHAYSNTKDYSSESRNFLL